ncbi:glycosyltransferase family 2 protein [Rhodopirellula baltica]|uniref:Glycosyl transferase family 2 n=1 Tax=Rhodopirellula baltica SWK14 TaxID=993516 RepID=L7C9P9_RHOBT|nr:glycosyltransferase family 2 protein [Rhodopirellula baltica]ELP30525.1 glycosyl transferase family 2 [Rhodopirellula baltica SWK14]
MLTVVIQIPCFNESETIGRVLDDLPAHIPGVDRIKTLVVDDGSTDETIAVARRHGVDHVHALAKNRGLAAAYCEGLRVAIGLGADIVVNTDGDCQYPGRYIESLVAPIVAGKADLVIGDRHPASDLRCSRWKRILQKAGQIVVSVAVGQRLRDPVSGFRAISREVASGLKITSRFSYTLESLMRIANTGARIDHVPVKTNSPTRPSRLFRSVPQFVCRSAWIVTRTWLTLRTDIVRDALTQPLSRNAASEQRRNNVGTTSEQRRNNVDAAFSGDCLEFSGNHRLRPSHFGQFQFFPGPA